MWFEKLTGFQEESPENVRKKIKVDGEYLTLLSNGKKLRFGKLDIPTLEHLRKNVAIENEHKITVNEIVADVKKLHTDLKNQHALFQVASQFNLLEMISPNVTPEQGIDGYEYDHTQGPICAIACGAGTIYRNYFAKVNNQIGQTKDNQINCLEELEREINLNYSSLWEMKNGYVLPTEESLTHIDKQISLLNDPKREQLKGKLKIGLQWNTEVTISETKHIVSQAYCSALPVAYSHIPSQYWENFAKLILEASYEATLYAALQNLKNHLSDTVYLTLLGGGAFGNEMEWITDSMKKAIHKFRNTPLKVFIVSYGQSNHHVISMIEELKKEGILN